MPGQLPGTHPALQGMHGPHGPTEYRYKLGQGIATLSMDTIFMLLSAQRRQTISAQACKGRCPRDSGISSVGEGLASWRSHLILTEHAFSLPRCCFDQSKKHALNQDVVDCTELLGNMSFGMQRRQCACSNDAGEGRVSVCQWEQWLKLERSVGQRLVDMRGSYRMPAAILLLTTLWQGPQHWEFCSAHIALAML
eukprot:scaffold10253_cov17-Tisochrysis_lutea.AAC.2